MLRKLWKPFLKILATLKTFLDDRTWIQRGIGFSEEELSHSHLPDGIKKKRLKTCIADKSTKFKILSLARTKNLLSPHHPSSTLRCRGTRRKKIQNKGSSTNSTVRYTWFLAMEKDTK